MGNTFRTGKLMNGLYVDDSGNVGIGTIPKGVSTAQTLEIGSRGTIYDNNDNFAFANNLWYDTQWKYKQTGAACIMSTNNGTFVFENAPSGTQNASVTFTERMRITNSGNVGIGTSSPNGILNLATTNDTILTFTANSVRTGYLEAFNNGSSAIFNIFADQSATPLAFGTNGSERMRITSSGNVGIGTSSLGSWAKLQVAGNMAISGTGYYFSNDFVGGVTPAWLEYNYTNGNLDLGSYGPSANGYIRFIAGGTTERMRITSGGYLKASSTGSYVNSARYHEFTTSNSDSSVLIANTLTSGALYGLLISFRNQDPNNSGNEFLYCEGNGSAQRFSVRSNGGVYNYSANNVNLSDISTKKDIIPCESYWDKFKAIEIVKFKYIDQTHEDYNIGVIAQQVEQVAPEFIDEENWGNSEETKIMKAVYTEDLHHATIKVLQEAMAKIEELSAKVTALENK